MHRIMDRLRRAYDRLQAGKRSRTAPELREQVRASATPDPAAMHAGQAAEAESLATIIRRYRAYALTP